MIQHQAQRGKGAPFSPYREKEREHMCKNTLKFSKQTSMEIQLYFPCREDKQI